MAAVPAVLRQLSPAQLKDVLARIDQTPSGERFPATDDVRAAVKHFLAVLTARAPGKSVEVRVPPYAAVQCVEGARHTRGTPPAVVETDPGTWLALARGQLHFAEAVRGGSVRASGERSDLSRYLPLS